MDDVSSGGRNQKTTEVTSENTEVAKKRSGRRRNFTEENYKKIFYMFMSFVDGTTYEVNEKKTFTEDEICSITPSDVVSFFNYKTFGSVEPSEDTFDRTNVLPFKTSTSTLIYWKKAISYFLPPDQAKRKWDPQTGNGNPTKTPEVDKILEIVKDKEQLISRTLKNNELATDSRGTVNISKRREYEKGDMRSRVEAQKLTEKDWEAGSSDENNDDDFDDDGGLELQLDQERKRRRTGEMFRPQPQSRMNFRSISSDVGVHVGVAVRQMQEQLDEMQFQLTELQGTVQNLVSRQETDREMARDHFHTLLSTMSDMSRSISSIASPSSTELQLTKQSAASSSGTHITSVGRSRKRKETAVHTQSNERGINAGPGTKVDENSKFYEFISPDATILSCPATLYLLWEEYTKGVNGRKPAREFNRWERGRVSKTYSFRKAFWDLVEKLISAGLTSDEVIKRIYNVYGENATITKIITGIKRDQIEDTLHSSLRV